LFPASIARGEKYRTPPPASLPATGSGTSTGPRAARTATYCCFWPLELPPPAPVDPPVDDFSP